MVWILFFHCHRHQISLCVCVNGKFCAVVGVEDILTSLFFPCAALTKRVELWEGEKIILLLSSCKWKPKRFSLLDILHRRRNHHQIFKLENFPGSRKSYLFFIAHHCWDNTFISHCVRISRRDKSGNQDKIASRFVIDFISSRGN